MSAECGADAVEAEMRCCSFVGMSPSMVTWLMTAGRTIFLLLQRYARKDVAAGEQRGYLHCAALRFELQGRYVQAICPPAHGEHFESVAFRALFDAWFPQRLAEDAGSIWFDDSRLLRSQLLCLEADAARAAATEG